ncbi:phenol-soluble modulin PSM-delta, partial [Staphylococcus epidermidis]
VVKTIVDIVKKFKK